MLDESRESKTLRLKRFADHVDTYVVRQWVRRRRDTISAAHDLGLEPATIGAVVSYWLGDRGFDR